MDPEPRESESSEAVGRQRKAGQSKYSTGACNPPPQTHCVVGIVPLLAWPRRSQPRHPAEPHDLGDSQGPSGSVGAVDSQCGRSPEPPSFSLSVFSLMCQLSVVESKSATFPSEKARHLLDDSVLESRSPRRALAASSAATNGLSLGKRLCLSPCVPGGFPAGVPRAPEAFASSHRGFFSLECGGQVAGAAGPKPGWQGWLLPITALKPSRAQLPGDPSWVGPGSPHVLVHS